MFVLLLFFVYELKARNSLTVFGVAFAAAAALVEDG
jgi:hypothetical protein